MKRVTILFVCCFIFLTGCTSPIPPSEAEKHFKLEETDCQSVEEGDIQKNYSEVNLPWYTIDVYELQDATAMVFDDENASEMYWEILNNCEIYNMHKDLIDADEFKKSVRLIFEDRDYADEIIDSLLAYCNIYSPENYYGLNADDVRYED